MHTQPEYPFIVRPAVVFHILFVQEINVFQIDQPSFQERSTRISPMYRPGISVVLAESLK